MKTGTVTFLLVALLLMVSFAAYNGERFNTANPESGRSSELFVIGDTAGFPEGCDPITLTHIILDFFDAYNNGQAERFAEFFPPNFAWYSDGDSEADWFFDVSSREKLLPFFAERHRQHERLSLVVLHIVNSENDRPDLIHMSYS